MRSTGGIGTDRMFDGEPMSYGRGRRWGGSGNGEKIELEIGKDGNEEDE
jgi:hypothetical protein